MYVYSKYWIEISKVFLRVLNHWLDSHGEGALIWCTQFWCKNSSAYTKILEKTKKLCDWEKKLKTWCQSSHRLAT